MRGQTKGRSVGPRDYTGSDEAGGYPHTGPGSGGTQLPQGWSGTRYGAESEGARQAAYFMEDPAQVRARVPRSYKRSDARVREDICEALAADRRIDATGVSVDVREGHVMLEGSVPERRMKYVIEDIAASCLHANDVDNRISVARSGSEIGGAAGNTSGTSSGAGDTSGTSSGAGNPSGTSELGNFAGTSGTTGRPAGVTTPPSGREGDGAHQGRSRTRR